MGHTAQAAPHTRPTAGMMGQACGPAQTRADLQGFDVCVVSFRV
jgi:hypothetical protein